MQTGSPKWLLRHRRVSDIGYELITNLRVFVFFLAAGQFPVYFWTVSSPPTLWNLSLLPQTAALRGKQTGREAAMVSFIPVPAGIALTIWRTHNYGDIWGDKLSLCNHIVLSHPEQNGPQWGDTGNRKTRNNIILAKRLQYHCLPVVWSWGEQSTVNVIVAALVTIQISHMLIAWLISVGVDIDWYRYQEVGQYRNLRDITSVEYQN